MELKTAKVLAKKFIEQRNNEKSPDSDYFFEVKEVPIDFHDRWFFGLNYNSNKGVESEDDPQPVGGAMGVTINKQTQSADYIPYMEYLYLQKIKQLRDRLSTCLKNSIDNGISVKELKEISSLNIAGLKYFKAKIMESNVQDESVKNQLIDEIIHYICNNDLEL